LFAKEWLSDPLIAGCLLPVTGVILLLASRWKEAVGDYRTMTPWQAIKIGLAQACAILPGLSRSGTTIAAGLMTGLSPRSAATFSFLLALPAIAGAGVLELIAMSREETSGTPVSYLLLAATVSFVVGLAAIAGLVRLLERGKLHWFAWWCIPAGLAVIAMYWQR
ncbi:MAG TPA: undecaprenyl-diphosphate phosphatase, partial [Pirellulaceae bacterium]|nr:undecaprenyl-diphosphate phosphatase [Pirellulaceae bacterium]